MTVASLDYSPAARLTCQDLGEEVLGDGEWASSRGGGVRRTDPGLREYLQCRYAGMGTEGSVSLEVRPKSGSRFGVHSNRQYPGASRRTPAERQNRGRRLLTVSESLITYPRVPPSQ